MSIHQRVSLTDGFVTSLLYMVKCSLSIIISLSLVDEFL